MDLDGAFPRMKEKYKIDEKMKLVESPNQARIKNITSQDSRRFARKSHDRLGFCAVAKRL